MPVTLPSGLIVWLSANHIMEPDRNWFKAPKNHFWHAIPDDEVNSPPFAREDTFIRRYVHSPIPASREEMAQYVHVNIGHSDDSLYWRGDVLSDFPRYGPLDADDMAAWNTWKASDEVQQFLDRVIAYCKTQSAILDETAVGYVVLSDVTETDDGGFVGKKIIDYP
jgi:hypothetical protein